MLSSILSYLDPFGLHGWTKSEVRSIRLVNAPFGGYQIAIDLKYTTLFVSESQLRNIFEK